MSMEIELEETIEIDEDSVTDELLEDPIDYDYAIAYDKRMRLCRNVCDILTIFLCFVLTPVTLGLVPWISAVLTITVLCNLHNIFTQDPPHLPIGVKILSTFSKFLYYLTNCVPVRWIRIIVGINAILARLSKTPEGITETKITISYTDELRKRDSKVDVYTYTLSDRKETAQEVIMIFFHAGGYVMGHPRTFEAYFRELLRVNGSRYSDQFHLKIVAPNYRKAPEYKVDSILREQVEILKFLVQQHPKCRNFVISGDSAGGNLACLVANYLRDTGYSIIRESNLHVIPIYPAILRPKDEELMEEKLPSHDLYGKNGYVVTKGNILSSYRQGQENDVFQGKYNKYDVIGKTRNLPSYLIVGAAYDYLCSESEVYAERLKKDGNGRVEFMKIQDIHGFCSSNFGVEPTRSKAILVENVLRSICDRFIVRKDEDSDEDDSIDIISEPT